MNTLDQTHKLDLDLICALQPGSQEMAKPLLQGQIHLSNFLIEPDKLVVNVVRVIAIKSATPCWFWMVAHGRHMVGSARQKVCHTHVLAVCDVALSCWDQVGPDGIPEVYLGSRVIAACRHSRGSPVCFLMSRRIPKKADRRTISGKILPGRLYLLQSAGFLREVVDVP